MEVRVADHSVKIPNDIDGWDDGPTITEWLEGLSWRQIGQVIVVSGVLLFLSWVAAITLLTS